MSESPHTGAFRPPARKSRSPLVVGLVALVLLLGVALFGALSSNYFAKNSAPTEVWVPVETVSSAPGSVEAIHARYGSSKEISAHMTLGNVGCDNYEPTERAERGAIDRAICFIGDNDMILSIFPGPEAVKSELGDHQRLNKLVPGVVDVAGPNWLVGGVDDLELAEQIAEALGGTVVDFDEIGDDSLPDFSA